MRFIKFTTGLLAMAELSTSAKAPSFPKEDLVLCDCGIGDNPDHPKWSTSRQMNWYKDIQWPKSEYTYPKAPDMAAEIPFGDGHYPWIPTGATARMSNGDVWSVYIEDGTPDGFKAGSAVSSKESDQVLNCWAYRGRPVSAAVNKTLNNDAVCRTAFVCNRENQPPPHPKDAQTSSPGPSPPATTYYSETPAPHGPTTKIDIPAPTGTPDAASLFLSAAINPRFITWSNTWESFISNFIWDQATGRCIGSSVRGDGYTLNFDCAGIRIDSDSHMTLVLIRALHDAGMRSLWFNQSPVIPSNNSTMLARVAARLNATSWVIMPEAVSFQAIDVARNQVVGYLSYNTTYDNFLSGPCSVCDAKRFNADFFDPIIAALQGTYPLYDNYKLQAQCEPWMACMK